MAQASTIGSTAGEYGAFQKLLHWVTAALVLFMIALGLYMTRAEIGLGERFQLYQLHKSIGVTVLLLTLVRFAWRSTFGVPALPEHIAGWERAAAHAVHGGLYALLIAMTLTGWAMVSVAAFSVPTLLYGVIPWPHVPYLTDLPTEDKKAAEAVFKTTHALLSYTLAALATLHIAAALRHAIFLKDGVMSRMLPRLFALASAAVFGAFAAASDARAYQWDVSPKNSKVTFELSAGGQTVKGEFANFRTEIRFDPDLLADATFNVIVDVASLKTGVAEVDKTLPSSEWFDAPKFPQAVFRSAGAKKTGEDKFEAAGDLTVKGVTRPATLTFTVEIDGAEAAGSGELVIDRLGHGVGPEAVAGIPVPKEVPVKITVKGLRLDN